jgi:hypothetical protein
MKDHHHWWDWALAGAAWAVSHFDAPAVVQLLTILVLIVRLALSIREWFKGRK